MCDEFLSPSNTVKILASEILCFIDAAYEAYKANHDFVVVEGISLKRPGDDTTLLNAKIASTFGLPVLMVTNARKAAGVGERRIVRWDKLEWEREIAFNVQISASIMKRQFVDILGSVVYRLPSTKRGDRQLYKHFKDLKIPLLGAVPEHPILKRIKVIYKLKIFIHGVAMRISIKFNNALLFFSFLCYILRLKILFLL